MKPLLAQSQTDKVYSGAVFDGRYQLVDEIGRGNMGRVYRAKQLRVNREVAVKVLRPDLILDDRVVARFEREAQAVAKLHHPGCLTLHDFGYDEALGSLFMVTELLDGVSLADVKDSLPDVAKLHVGFFIADALKHAHENGIVHRDLKPENVMVMFEDDGGPRIKVLDFGLARLFDQSDTSGERRRLTLSGEIHGSPRYLSPEQCRGALDIGAPSDMYSFGALLYELFEGQVPFPGPSVPAVLTAHVSDAPPPMTSFPVIDVEQLIYELLAKDPADRPTAHEARDVFARHVDLQRSGVFDAPQNVGLAEHTLGSDAFDDAPRAESVTALDANPATPALPPPPPRTEPRVPVSPPTESSELEMLLTSREARLGAVTGSILTLVVLGLLALLWWALH